VSPRGCGNVSIEDDRPTPSAVVQPGVQGGDRCFVPPAREFGCLGVPRVPLELDTTWARHHLCPHVGNAVHSLSRPAQCWDNAVVESWFGTYKLELIEGRTWPTTPRCALRRGSRAGTTCVAATQASGMSARPLRTTEFTQLPPKRHSQPVRPTGASPTTYPTKCCTIRSSRFARHSTSPHRRPAVACDRNGPSEQGCATPTLRADKAKAA
jgi:hypothetical protein